MTRARIEKLEALLARVERRRAEPRLVPVGMPDGASNNNVAERVATPSLSGQTISSPRPRPMAPGVAFPDEPSSSHLGLDHPSRRASSLPPPPTATADTLRQPATPPPPEADLAPPVRTPTEVLPTAPQRIAPQPPASAESAVQVVSAPRIDAPRSFGDLLALSLSLRPR